MILALGKISEIKTTIPHVKPLFFITLEHDITCKWNRSLDHKLTLPKAKVIKSNYDSDHHC